MVVGGRDRWNYRRGVGREVTKSRSRRWVMWTGEAKNRGDRGADEGESNMDWWEIEGKNR